MTTPEHTHAKILVVEDDDDLRDELGELLSTHGFDVVSAENGEVGLTLLRAQRDIRGIILDVGMPVMNGASFRGEQLSDPQLASIPMILVTGREDIATLATILRPAACVKKPALGELMDVIERCI